MTRQAILFPGQGAQKVGMGRDFAERFPVARDLFARADAVLDFDLTRLCFEGPTDELTLTRNCQPAIYVTSAAIVTALEAEGILARNDVAATAGLSLGEYTALWYAGAFSFEDGLKLVARRGAAMQDASDDPPSGMISLLGADPETAQRIADEAADGEVLQVANLLSPGQIVLSGTKTAIARVPDVAKRHGVRRALPLNVAGAFHSPLMQRAADRLRDELDSVAMTAPRIPVYGNVTGTAVKDAATIRANLALQVVKPVRWQDGMEALVAAGFSDFVEPGPGRVLGGLLRKIAGDTTCRGYDTVEDLG